AAHYKRVYRAAGWISPVILLNGRVIGTWARARKGKGISLAVTPFAKLDRQLRAAIEEEAVSLGAYLEAACQVVYTK
ncbi:MAG: DNA glycosylase AlkZ-like family protein, partial [Terriglobales bacterium]